MHTFFRVNMQVGDQEGRTGRPMTTAAFVFSLSD